MENSQLVELTADIVAAHVEHNTVAVGDLPNLIRSVHRALEGLGAPIAEEPQGRNPAVSVRASVKPDAITCMVCGRKQKTLKRHIATAHDLTPEQYRAEFGLARDYPMVAPNYAERRRQLAHAIGLGRKQREKVPQPGDVPSAVTKGRGRPRKKAAMAAD